MTQAPAHDPARALVVVGNSEGGGAQIALDLIAALDSARYQITLVAPASAALSAWASAHNIDFQPMPLMRSRTGGAPLDDLRALISRLRPGIIHAHGTRAAWFISRCLPGRASAPLIYSEHLFSFEARRGPARLPWLALETYLCRRATVVTTSCERNARFAERVRRGERGPVTVRHYGIDSAGVWRQVAQARDAGDGADALAPPLGAPLIGSVGRLIPQKGLRYLIEAAPAILRAAPSARFLIVGEGPERAALEAQCRAAGLSDRFYFTGARERPWELLARCDVIALPSLWEGLPLTLLEALAAGLPVVASDVGGAREALGPHLRHGLTPPRDAAALASAITRLLGERELRASFQREGPLAAARYDIQRTQREFAALYESLGRTDARLTNNTDMGTGYPQTTVGQVRVE